ncbi:MAG TPA: hypothetical protein VLH18_06515, partial [Candidatus Limnocylindrales bacterium]|nr:hypothetical protein [Candidatus Limnocylindrales bacterium]
MNSRTNKAEKAYANPDFLNSSDGRILRIMSEFVEPMYRFKQQNISDTIVFFGSARTKKPRDAKKLLEAA